MAPPPAKPKFAVADFPSTGLGTTEALTKFFTTLGGFSDQTAAALSALSFGQNFNAEVKDVVFQTPADKWTYIGAAGAPAFQNAWVNAGGVFPPARYFKDTAGVVWVQGVITGGAMGTNAFVLPAGYRPAYTTGFAVHDWNGAALVHGGLYINNGGGVRPTDGSNVEFHLNGASYPADDGSSAPGVLSCFPLQVTSTVANVQGVEVLKIRDMTSSTQVLVAAGVPHWEAVAGGFRLLNLPGLALGKKYEVTLLVTGG